MLATLLVALTVFTIQGRFNDPDMWWHLRLGEIIWHTQSIPRVDFLSFTTMNHAWTAHEWLAQLSIYGAWRAGGNTGLMLWLCFFAGLLFVSLYLFCSLYSGNAKVALLGGLTGWLCATIGLAVRPLVIGHLLLVLELIIIELARTRNRRWLWTLPPLFAVWVNCHGSYWLGVFVLAVFCACSFFEFSAPRLICRSWPADVRASLLLAGVLSIGALFLNPVGVRLLVYPFDTLLNQSNISYVAEWQPLDPHDPRTIGLFAIAGVLFLMTLLRSFEFRLQELILMAAAFAMALLHQRLLFACGILLAPILCRMFAGDWERYDPRRDHRIANALFMTVAAVAATSVFPNRQALEDQIGKTSPVRAVDFIRRAKLEGPMLNEYEFGGYLIWALPEQKVFIDGRADVYDWSGVISAYARWAYLQEDPNLLLDKYKVSYCLLKRNSGMARVLSLLPGWKEVYSDKLAVIFTRSK